jgi:hypothetical protein
MTRLLICLCLCLVFAVLYRCSEAPPAAAVSAEPDRVVSLRPEWLTVLASDAGAGLPAGLPWAGLARLGQGDGDAADPLPNPDPVAFLELCLDHYDRAVKSYTVVLSKQERVAGNLKAHELVDVAFKGAPFSVFMKWRAGVGKAQTALYVDGENNNQMLVLPAGLLKYLGVVELELNDPDVKDSGRYTINEFGLRKAAQRVLDGWRKARARGALDVKYEGVYRVGEAGGRACYKLHRTHYDRPEEDGITDLVIYVDTETLLQVGIVVRGPGERLIGEYYFRDLVLNPEIPATQFQRDALKH